MSLTQTVRDGVYDDAVLVVSGVAWLIIGLSVASEGLVATGLAIATVTSALTVLTYWFRHY